jgi:hypothetical protein
VANRFLERQTVAAMDEEIVEWLARHEHRATFTKQGQLMRRSDPVAFGVEADIVQHRKSVAGGPRLCKNAKN